MDEYLAGVYYDISNPASYSTAQKLHIQARKDNRNYTLSNIENWLKKQETYTLFKPIAEKGKRPRVVVPDKFYQFDADTMNMVKWGKFNEGNSYILIIIDILSRFTWTFPLHTVSGKETVQNLQKLFSHQKCDVFRTDSGPEFRNKWVKTYLQELKIKHVMTRNETKANYAERVIKTLKSKLVKNMYYNQTHRWIDDLDHLTNSYNLSYHRSIKMSPKEAINTDDVDLWRAQYLPSVSRPFLPKNKRKDPRKQSRNIFKFDIGDTVRLAKFKKTFTRAYDENWTHELFIVVDRHAQQGVSLYTVKSWDNELIDGKFYENELKKVKVSENTVYKIEKIIKRKKQGRRSGYIVRWLGWPARYDSWVSDSDFRDIKSIN